VVEHLSVAGAVVPRAAVWVLLVAAAGLLGTATPAAAQTGAPCRFICELEWKVEPTFTVENLAKRHRVSDPESAIERATRERVFETVFALDMPTSLPRLGFTAEAIFAPFSDDNDVELEMESNFQVLREEATGGWVSSHFDIVDQFSPAERPGSRRAYTHKLDFELDTALHLFNALPEGKWLRGLEVEVSLDYLATGTPRKGDIFSDGTRFLDNASPWSVSFVIVIPVAPF
jgi:hypothetical protein